nr:16S rRNA (uracil(1498)-N(3))-methyltransferase [uncultured Acetobacter sp.]
MSSPEHLPRLFVPQDALSAAAEAGTACTLSPAQARYLGTVLRKTAGNPVRVFNTEMGEWLGTLGEIRKDRGSLTLTQQLRAPCPQPELILAFALLKRDATDMVLRMGTELGVTRFMPIITERTNTHRINPERLMTIAAEASEQCERLDIPTLAEPCTLASLLGAWPEDKRLFTAMERAEDRGVSLRSSLQDAREGDGLLIGPEGGFSEAECRALLARPAIAPISLGPLVLRADTAVAAGLALMGHGLRSAQD